MWSQVLSSKMEKLPMCRICLVQNVRMYLVVNRNFHELYEKLTDIPFVTGDRRPILVCFFCCARLEKCYQLMKKCLEAEELFAQMMNEDYQPNPLINQDHLEYFGGFIKSPTENISIVDGVQTESVAIKEELPAVCEGLDDIIEPKEEHQSDEVELENVGNSCLYVADIPPHHSESDLEDDVPLMQFKTKVDEEQEVSNRKRRARETKSATVAKKPKLDTQKTKLEDALTVKQTKKEKSDLKVFRTTHPDMANWNVGRGEDVPEGFESLLRDSDSEDEDPEEEFFELLEPEVQEEVTGEYEKPDLEYVDSPPTLLGLNTQEGEEIPLDLPLSPPKARSSPPVMPSPPRAPVSPTLVENAENGSQLVEVVEEGDVLPLDSGDFHLADEHHTFSQVVERPSTLSRPQRGVRGRRQGRGARGVREARGMNRPAGQPQWRKGDRCVHVYVNDDDVPEDLRATVLKVVRNREAAKERATAKERRQMPVSAQDKNEEFLDAEDGQEEALFAEMEVSSCFEWSSMTDYSGDREEFLPKLTGPTVASENAYGAFRQYWDDGILSHIVTESNRYAQGMMSSSASFARDWYDTNVHEILILFSFWMMLGIIKMPSTKSCFTTNPLLQTNIFRKMFSRRRYKLLCRALHFNDNCNRPTDINTDRLFSLGPVLQHLNSRFKEAYVPSQNICIDESLTLWKGNFGFRQYVKTKAAKFGVKTFELCESSTGYLWSFSVYIGGRTAYDPTYPLTLLKSTSTVLNLIRPLLNKGYTLFMDNKFSSPLLARFLKAHKTDCVGTLRANRSHVPPLISLCQLKEGQFVARHSGDIVIMAYKDMKRKISTISTYHGIQQDLMAPKPYREAQYKPQIILDYSKGMGGFDRKDQMLEPYLLERKRYQKWNMKVFKRLLNCSILNARILYETSIRTSKDHLVFRLELVEQIMQHHHGHIPKMTRRRMTARASTTTLAQPEFTSGHFPRQNDLLPNGRRARRRCLRCSLLGVRRCSIYVCTQCNVPLCIEPCFKLHHMANP